MPALCLAVRGRRPRGLPHELRASRLPLLPLGRAKPSPRFLLLGVLPDLVCGLVLPCPPHTCQCPGLSSPGASVPHVASQAPAPMTPCLYSARPLQAPEPGGPGAHWVSSLGRHGCDRVNTFHTIRLLTNMLFFAPFCVSCLASPPPPVLCQTGLLSAPLLLTLLR